MLDHLWAGMILAGILWAAFHGRLSDVTLGMLDGAADAVSLGITMLGVLTFWSGILKIGERSGLVDWLAGKMGPVLRFLFPRLDPEHPAMRYIAVNMIANMLGLGSAATPAGLAGFKELERVEEERRVREGAGMEQADASLVGSAGSIGQKGKEGQRKRIRGRKSDRAEKRYGAIPKGTASNEMCTFLILNISSLQLIPVNIIAYRSQYGSADPAAIVGPAIVATAVSTAVAVVFCKVMDRKID